MRMAVLLPFVNALLSQPAMASPTRTSENRPDQHGRMLMNADDLTLMGQKVLIDRGRDRVSIRGQPHPSTVP